MKRAVPLSGILKPVAFNAWVLFAKSRAARKQRNDFFPRALESWLAMFQAAPELRELLRLLAANNPYP